MFFCAGFPAIPLWDPLRAPTNGIIGREGARIIHGLESRIWLSGHEAILNRTSYEQKRESMGIIALLISFKFRLGP